MANVGDVFVDHRGLKYMIEQGKNGPRPYRVRPSHAGGGGLLKSLLLVTPVLPKGGLALVIAGSAVAAGYGLYRLFRKSASKRR